MPERSAVTWQPAARKVQHVVLLVDESVRADYIDWTPGNGNTPALASLKDRLVDFGPAASGGNCSHYSNAILRFGGARDDLIRTLTTSPTMWQYAKTAGYRTVFIDAQAGFIKSSGKLQNFMTPEEAKYIDDMNTADATTPAPELDDRLMDVLVQKLKSDQPTFIYAVKNGAHFPYDRAYPENERQLRPVMGEALPEDTAARINSYRNVIRWSVDRIIKRLAEEADLKDTVVIYTSDHGQNLTHTRLSHCTVEDPDPREGLVPLFVMTGDPALRTEFAAAARDSKDHGSHFTIAPTLLQLFGYDAAAVRKQYGASLLEKNDAAPAFTSGDVFGMFSKKVRWHPLDVGKSYLENPASPQMSAHASAGGRPR
jgi:lipid A ethanolaminephosphotransferase